MMVLFLQYILKQPQDSMIKKFLLLQFKEPTKGDWGSTSLKALKDLGIYCSLEEIKQMTKYKLKKILKERIDEKAFLYLMEKQGKKGREIKYESLKMANYLLPGEENLTIENKRNIFSIKNF